MTDPDEINEALSAEFSTAITQYSEECGIRGIKSLESYDPTKVATILMAFSRGKSQTHIVKKMGMDRNTVIRVLTTYADHMGEWRELGGKLSAYNYLNMSSLEEDMITSVREQMEGGELKPTFRDIKELSIAKTNAGREALVARGEVTSRVEAVKTYTDEEYEELRDRAQEALMDMKNVTDV
jgi:hypothetical protein